MIGKKYFYKIYTKDGIYITTWKDVSSPNFSYKINSGYSDLTIKMGRKFNDFGEGSDVQVGNQLKLVISDAESSDGVTIYNGQLTKYHMIYEDKKETVEVTFTGYVTELSKRIIEDTGGETTILYSAEDPSDVIKDVLDKYNGTVTYTTDSILSTGVSVSYDVIQNTVLEVIQKMSEIAPANWYWYVDKDNNLNFKPYDASNPLKLFLGNHINRLDVTKTGETLYNTYFFLGGGSPQLYKKYERTSSQNTYGRSDKREQDERVTLAATASNRANSFLSENSTLQMEVSVTVIDSNIDPSRGVDIDALVPGMSIQIIDPNVPIGQTKWGSFTWGIDYWGYDITRAINRPLRLEQIDYFGTGATLKLGSLIPTIGQEIHKNTIQLETFRGKDSPSTPS